MLHESHRQPTLLDLVKLRMNILQDHIDSILLNFLTLEEKEKAYKENSDIFELLIRLDEIKTIFNTVYVDQYLE